MLQLLLCTKCICWGNSDIWLKGVPIQGKKKKKKKKKKRKKKRKKPPKLLLSIYFSFSLNSEWSCRRSVVPPPGRGRRWRLRSSRQCELELGVKLVSAAWHGLVGRSVEGSHGSTRCATAVAGSHWICIFHFFLFTGQLKKVLTRGDPQRRPRHGGVWNKRTGEHQN